jgi:hypothetical protein
MLKRKTGQEMTSPTEMVREEVVKDQHRSIQEAERHQREKIREQWSESTMALTKFLPGLASNCDPPISISQVTWMTDVRHYAQPDAVVFLPP